MNCQVCDREAVARVTKIVSGEAQTLRLCRGHGKEFSKHVPILGAPGPWEPWPEEDVHMDLCVTQSQIEKGESVTVELPNGFRQNLNLPSGVGDGTRWRLGNGGSLSPDEGPFIYLTVRVVPEPQQEA